MKSIRIALFIAACTAQTALANQIDGTVEAYQSTPNSVSPFTLHIEGETAKRFYETLRDGLGDETAPVDGSARSRSVRAPGIQCLESQSGSDYDCYFIVRFSAFYDHAGGRPLLGTTAIEDAGFVAAKATKSRFSAYYDDGKLDTHGIVFDEAAKKLYEALKGFGAGEIRVTRESTVTIVGHEEGSIGMVCEKEVTIVDNKKVPSHVCSFTLTFSTPIFPGEHKTTAKLIGRIPVPGPQGGVGN